MPRVVTPAHEAQIAAMLAQGRPPIEVAAALGLGFSTVRERARAMRLAGQLPAGPSVTSRSEPAQAVAPAAAPVTAAAARTFHEEGDQAEITYETPQRIRTLEEAIAYAEVDLAVWRVAKWECTSWEVVARGESLVADSHGKTWKIKRPEGHQLWRVWMRLERLLPKPYLDASEAIFARLAGRAPRYCLPAVPRKQAPYFLELDLFDAHFANLAWAPEAGQNDDLHLKEAIFANAVDDLLARTAGYRVDEVLFPVGNDLHHVDTLSRTTTAGTPQDCDSRYAKMIEVTECSVIAAIERMLAVPTVRQVRVIYVPGNHDTISTLHLCRTLAAWFRRMGRVTVDAGPAPRKYLERGVCLFGYTHGEGMPDGKLKSLPTIMAVEQPEAWARTQCREWKLGHRHTSQTFETLSSTEFNGVMVRRLRALTRTNAWHHKNLWVGNSQAAEAYLYSREHGYEGHHVVKTRA